MRAIKVLLIVVEVCCICGVTILAFNHSETSDGSFFNSIYIILFTLLAVTCQKEQQAIDWEEEDVQGI